MFRQNISRYLFLKRVVLFAILVGVGWCTIIFLSNLSNDICVSHVKYENLDAHVDSTIIIDYYMKFIVDEDGKEIDIKKDGHTYNGILYKPLSPFKEGEHVQFTCEKMFHHNEEKFCMMWKVYDPSDKDEIKRECKLTPYMIEWRAFDHNANLKGLEAIMYKK